MSAPLNRINDNRQCIIGMNQFRIDEKFVMISHDAWTAKRSYGIDRVAWLRAKRGHIAQKDNLIRLGSFDFRENCLQRDHVSVDVRN